MRFKLTSIKNIATPIYILLLISLLTLSSCSSNKGNVAGNKSRTETTPLFAELKLFHQDENNSILYFKIDGSTLIYLRKDENENFASELTLHYTLLTTENQLLDSNTIRIQSTKEKSGITNDILGEIPLKINLPEFKIQIYIKDELKKSVYFKKEILANKNRFSENLLFRDFENKQIIFSPYLNSPSEIYVECNKNMLIDVKHFSKSNLVNPPPFSTSSPSNGMTDIDTSFRVNSNTQSFLINKKGVYQLGSSTGEYTGTTRLIYLSSDFPEIKTTEGMHESIRYISSKEEYEKIEESKNKKIMIDQFWLNITNGNKDRAKVLIQEYYHRIHLANKYYSTYKDGWKTDRGMISVIFGFPRNVFNGNGTETWIYGDPSSLSSLTFTFKEMENPFGVKEYELVRYKSYKDFWYRAVDTWRKGRVFVY